MNKLRISKKTLLLLVPIVVLLAVGGVYAYTHWVNNDPTLSDPTIDYGPPTKEEQQAGDDVKQDIVKEDQQEQKPSTTPTSASVVITDASQYGNEIEVRAYVENIYQEGTCTFTFTKGSSSFEKQSPATKEATNTQCKSITVPRSAFSSAGTWKVTVAYQSTKGSGETSQTLQIK